MDLKTDVRRFSSKEVLLEISQYLHENTLRKVCPYSELFWSVFSRIPTDYGRIRRIFPHLVRMWENTDQNNSEYGQLLRSKTPPVKIKKRISKRDSSTDVFVMKHFRWQYIRVTLNSIPGGYCHFENLVVDQDRRKHGSCSYFYRLKPFFFSIPYLNSLKEKFSIMLNP